MKKEIKLEIDTEVESLVPPLSEGEYESLKADIDKRGIQVDLVISVGTPDVKDGTIVSGHHRFKAAKELGKPDEEIPNKEETFIDRQEMLLYAAKDNLLRRQLNLYQKCMLIDKFMPYYEKLAAYNKQQGKIKGGKTGSRKGVVNRK